MIIPDQDLRLGPYVDEHYALLLYVLGKYSPQGVALEFGVGSGTSLRLIAEFMPVVGYGSEMGLPEDWREGFPRGSFAHKHPEGVVNATLVPGWFADTLPTFDFTALGEIALIHLDADLYSSTQTALKYVGPYIKSGCFIVMDEAHGFDGAEQHEQRAFLEYVADHNVRWRSIGCGHESLAIQIC